MPLQGKIKGILKQRSFSRAIIVSLISASASTLLKIMNGWTDPVNKETYGANTKILPFLPDDEIYKAIVFIVSFLVVFRSGYSVNRYMEASEFVYSFTGNWYDVCSSLVAFCRLSKKPPEDIRKFQHVLVRLVSMLNSLCFAELEETAANESKKSVTYEMIDVQGIDADTRKAVRHSSCKVETVFQMLQVLVVHGSDAGILAIPPPILSRAFQEMGSGMLQFHSAMKLARMPLPFHYHFVSRVVLGIYTVFTPLMYAKWSVVPHTVFVSVFLMTFVIWFMQGMSSVLEHPFGCNVGIIDMHDVHEVLNSRLLTLLKQALQPVAQLSEIAELDIQSLEDKPSFRDALDSRLVLDRDLDRDKKRTALYKPHDSVDKHLDILFQDVAVDAAKKVMKAADRCASATAAKIHHSVVGAVGTVQSIGPSVTRVLSGPDEEDPLVAKDADQDKNLPSGYRSPLVELDDVVIAEEVDSNTGQSAVTGPSLIGRQGPTSSNQASKEQTQQQRRDPTSQQAAQGRPGPRLVPANPVGVGGIGPADSVEP